jgi:hypothetical protein
MGYPDIGNIGNITNVDMLHIKLNLNTVSNSQILTSDRNGPV